MRAYRDSGREVDELRSVLRLTWHCERQFELAAVVHVEVIVAGEVCVKDEFLGSLRLGVKQHILAEKTGYEGV